MIPIVPSPDDIFIVSLLVSNPHLFYNNDNPLPVVLAITGCLEWEMDPQTQNKNNDKK